ncbi:MAG: hypothetical protein A2046_11445 [Bacteroidetes bacterium GWA2_30_7]|nr:MAG: hypothetical protein A2046_11445 [Bacteroidetes bacterium GWA2_30_7]
MFKLVLLLSFLLFLYSCDNQDYKSLPLRSEKGFYKAVIEIPAGTNHKIEYDIKQKKFLCNQANGKDRIVDFLPYPANYGFIPSTLMDTLKGGDGDPLDVLVISESLPTKTVLEIIPIAIIYMIDDNEVDYKILAVPLKENLRVIKALSYEELLFNYPKIPEIISDWLINYKGTGKVTIERWASANEAIFMIKEWAVSEKK